MGTLPNRTVIQLNHTTIYCNIWHSQYSIFIKVFKLENVFTKHYAPNCMLAPKDSSSQNMKDRKGYNSAQLRSYKFINTLVCDCRTLLCFPAAKKCYMYRQMDRQMDNQHFQNMLITFKYMYKPYKSNFEL